LVRRLEAESSDDGLRHGIVWIAALFAFSPALLDLANGLTQTDANWSILIAPFLLAIALCRIDAPRSRSRLWPLWIAGAVACETFGIWLDAGSITRLSLPLAILGLALRAGWPPARISALAFWMVPLPVSLLAPTTPWLEQKMAAPAIALLSALGAEIHARGPVLLSGGRSLELLSWDGGQWLATVLAEMGWYAGLRRGCSVAGLFASAGLWALLALPAQPLVLMIGVALLSLGRPDWGRGWIHVWVYFLAALLALLWIERRVRAGAQRGSVRNVPPLPSSSADLPPTM